MVLVLNMQDEAAARGVSIDTGKLTLDVALDASDKTLKVDNTPEGWRQIARFLKANTVRRVGIEATGGYESGVLAYLREHEGEAILCVANLSRAPQAVELDRILRCDEAAVAGKQRQLGGEGARQALHQRPPGAG